MNEEVGKGGKTVGGRKRRIEEDARRGERRKESEREETQGERSSRESKEGANSPFYSKPGLPGCCQVTAGQSLEGMLTETCRLVD